MISGIVRFVLFRVLGARVLLVLTILGWVWNRLRGRRDPSEARGERDVSSRYRDQ